MYIMSKRDAKSGEYISNKQAASQDPSTWVEERDALTRKVLLRQLYEALLAKAGYAECEDFEFIKVENVQNVFRDFGLKA